MRAGILVLKGCESSASFTCLSFSLIGQESMWCFLVVLGLVGLVSVVAALSWLFIH